MMKTSAGSIYPVLPLRDIVVFPHMIVPLFVGREKSVQALDDVMRDDKQILLVTQKNAGQDDPAVEDIYRVGTIGTVLQLLKLPDGTVKVLVEGVHRARIKSFTDNATFFQAEAEALEDSVGQGQELEALSRAVIAQFEQYIKLNKKIAPEVLVSINQIDEPSKLADTVASASRAENLREAGIAGAGQHQANGLSACSTTWNPRSASCRSRKRIRNRVKRQMEKTQREYYLNEQLKAIQKELGEGEDGKRRDWPSWKPRSKPSSFSKEAQAKKRWLS
jgi:ATP-dependent Lon protease